MINTKYKLKPEHILKGHKSFVACAKFSIDGTNVITADNDGNVITWDTKTGKKVHPLMVTPRNDGWDGLNFIFHLDVSPDGKTVAAVCSWPSVVVWDTVIGRVLFSHTTPNSLNVNSARFNKTGNMLIICARDRIVVFDARTGERYFELPDRHNPRFADTNADNTKLLVVNQQGRVYEYDLLNGTKVNVIHIKEVIGRVAISNDFQKIATVACRSDMVRVWDLYANRQLFALEPDHDVSEVVFSPSGDEIAVISLRNGTTVWDIKTAEPLYGLRCTKAVQLGVSTVDFSPDGKYLVSDYDEKSAVIWRIHSRLRK